MNVIVVTFGRAYLNIIAGLAREIATISFLQYSGYHASPTGVRQKAL